MAYSPDPSALDFDASLCYSGGTDFDYACLGGNDLCLGGQPGGNDLNLGCWAPDAEPTGEDIACVVAATTKRPTAAVNVLCGRRLQLTATTRKPTAQVLLAQIFPTTVYATTRKPTANVQVADVRVVHVAARTAKPKCYTDLAYDPNLLSDVVGLTRDEWQPSNLVGLVAQSSSTDADRLSSAAVSLGRDASPCSQLVEALWQSAERLGALGQTQWADAPGMSGRGLAEWAGGPLAVAGVDDSWVDALRLMGPGPAAWKQWLPHRAPYPFVTGPTDFSLWAYQDYPPAGDAVDFPGEYKRENRPPRNGAALFRFADGIRETALIREPFSEGAWLPSSCDENSWNDGAWVGYVRRIPPIWERPPTPIEYVGNDLRLCQFGVGNNLDLGVVCSRHIPRQRSYRVNHSFSLTRLSDGQAIPCSNMTLSHDADSWAWAWSATILGAQALDAILPSALGEPVTLVAEINTEQWHVIVEDWTETRSFDSRSVTISGRGLTAWLGQPYEQPTTGTLESARTLNQAMEEMLPLGSGWTMNFANGTPDWLLPSGAWNWTGQSPIQAIHDAAQGVGLVIVPDLAAKHFTVQQRYPVNPWNFDVVPTTMTIPDSAIVQLTRRQAVPSQANAVYVHGAESGGIIARAWLSGSAGDKLASTVADERITHVDGGRLLGSRILAAHAEQPAIKSVTLPMGSMFFRGRIGDLVAIEVSGAEVRGIINAISISASEGVVRQTLTIGEDTPNVWANWRRLVPDAPVLLGTVLSIHEGGTRLVQLIGGGRQRVRGDASVGQTVWVRLDRIEGEAPSLPQHDIEVF